MTLLPPKFITGPRVLVCGGRDYKNVYRVFAVLNELHANTPISLIVQGEAKGADALAKWWAAKTNVPSMDFKAKWGCLGSSAGPRRNLQMIIEGQPDVVVAFPGEKGTRNMIKTAKSMGVVVIDLRHEVYGWVGDL